MPGTLHELYILCMIDIYRGKLTKLPVLQSSPSDANVELSVPIVERWGLGSSWGVWFSKVLAS